MHLPQLVTAIARQQHSLITLDQIRELGISRGLLRSWVDRGWLERLEPRLFRVAGAVETWDQRVLGGCLSVGPQSVACRRTAAVLWDLLRLRNPPIEIAVPRPRVPQWVSAQVFRSTDIIAAHRTKLRAIPVTTVPRTLVDLGAVVPYQMVEDAVDRALIGELASGVELRAMLDNVARQGRRGVGSLRRAIDDIPEGVESFLEAKLLRLIRGSTLPKPTIQHWVEINGRPRYRIDIAYPEAKIAIEGDGREWHAKRSVFEADRERQNALQLRGWMFLRYTYRQATRRREWVLGQIRDMHRVRVRTLSS